MTLTQLFEASGRHKIVWSKRGDKVDKRVVSSASSIVPRKEIETVSKTGDEESK